MARWEDFLQRGSWGGVEFDFLSAREERERVLDEREYPHRDGAEIEDRGRRRLTISVVAVFLEEDYPDRYLELLRAVDQGQVRELVHPVHGSIQCACKRAVSSHAAEEPDCAQVELTFVEHTEGALGPFSGNGAASRANLVRGAADDVDAAAAAMEAYLAELSPSPGPALASAPADARAAAAAAVSAGDQIESAGEALSAVEISSSVNGAAALVDAVLSAISDYGAPASYELSRALLALTRRLEELGQAVIETKPAILEVELQADMPLLVWVHNRYGDSAQADEILRLNAVPDPLLLRAGTRLRAYAV